MTHVISDNRFAEWAVKVVRVAMNNQDKTFRQLVDEKLVPSWAEYVLKH